MQKASARANANKAEEAIVVIGAVIITATVYSWLSREDLDIWKLINCFKLILSL